MHNHDSYEITITGRRIAKFIMFELLLLVLFSLPFMVLVYKFEYKFDNQVVNSLLIVYASYSFKRVFLVTVVFFMLETDAEADFSKNNKIHAYQASFIDKYPKIEAYNNIILSISGVIFVIGFIYFLMSTTSLIYQ